MNSRERVITAIHHNIPDRIPTDAIAIEIQDQLAEYLGIGQDKVIERLGLDGRAFWVPYIGPRKEPVDGIPHNEWGVLDIGDYGTAHSYPLANAHSLKNVADYPVPQMKDYDFGWTASQAKRYGKDYAVRGPYWLPLFSRACEITGMEELMVKLLHEPLIFEAIIERIFIYNCELAENILDACGDDMPIFCPADDFASQNGMLFSPKLWRKYLKPRYAKLFEIGKKRGKYIWFHACGDISAVLPDLIDIGMDVWETVQLHTLPFPPEKLKQEYGKHITFFGGITTQALPFISPEEVKRQTQHCIEVLGKDGGYICGPDHYIKNDVSPLKALALFETAQSFRKNGYTLLE